MFIAFLLGGLLLTFLVSRVLRATVFRRVSGWTRVLGANALTLGVATLVGGFGFADGAPPRFGYALTAYALPVLFWVVVDAIRDRRASATPLTESPPFA